MVAGDEAAPADFDVGQVAAAHFVVEQVAGQAGQAGGFVDGVGQPLGGPVGFRPAGLGGCRAAGGGQGRLIRIRWCQVTAARGWCALIGGLPRGRAGWRLVPSSAGLLGWPGGEGDRVGGGLAELGGPLADVRPDPVPGAQAARGRGGQRDRGDSGAAVQDWPGSQVTCPAGGRPETSRAVRAVRSLVIRSPVMVRGMGVRSWFGFQVWLGFAGAAGFQELGEG